MGIADNAIRLEQEPFRVSARKNIPKQSSWRKEPCTDKADHPPGGTAMAGSAASEQAALGAFDEHERLPFNELIDAELMNLSSESRYLLKKRHDASVRGVDFVE